MGALLSGDIEASRGQVTLHNKIRILHEGPWHSWR